MAPLLQLLQRRYLQAEAALAEVLPEVGTLRGTMATALEEEALVPTLLAVEDLLCLLETGEGVRDCLSEVSHLVAIGEEVAAAGDGEHEWHQRTRQSYEDDLVDGRSF